MCENYLPREINGNGYLILMDVCGNCGRTPPSIDTPIDVIKRMLPTLIRHEWNHRYAGEKQYCDSCSRDNGHTPQAGHFDGCEFLEVIKIAKKMIAANGSTGLVAHPGDYILISEKYGGITEMLRFPKYEAIPSGYREIKFVAGYEDIPDMAVSECNGILKPRFWALPRYGRRGG